MSLRNRSFFSKEWIFAIVPGSSSDNRFIFCFLEPCDHIGAATEGPYRQK
jgi:hypothetical protein